MMHFCLIAISQQGARDIRNKEKEGNDIDGDVVEGKKEREKKNKAAKKEGHS